MDIPVINPQLHNAMVLKAGLADMPRLVPISEEMMRNSSRASMQNLSSSDMEKLSKMIGKEVAKQQGKLEDIPTSDLT